MGGDIEVFSGGGELWEEKSRVQSPGPSPAFRICRKLENGTVNRLTRWPAPYISAIFIGLS